MPPRHTCPRLSKIARWGGAALTLLLVAGWIASNWMYFGIVSEAGAFSGLKNGRVIIGQDEGLKWADSDTAFWTESSWPTQMASKPGGIWQPADGVVIPLWPISVGLLLGTVAAWRTARHARPSAFLHACRECGYDRTGIAVGALCPECGASP
jgi:hypothetical protein